MSGSKVPTSISAKSLNSTCCQSHLLPPIFPQPSFLLSQTEQVKNLFLQKTMDSMVDAAPLPDLILSLEQATFMAKQLPNTEDPTHLLQIYSSLHHAHQHLSNFLSKIEFPLPPPAAENSISSATGAFRDENGSDSMQVGDDDEVEVEENYKGTSTIEEVEEKMRECFIRNKRPKRPLSPSAAAAVEEQRLSGDGFVGTATDFDPHATKLRALDMIYQFHG